MESSTVQPVCLHELLNMTACHFHVCVVVVLVWRHGYHPNNAGIIQTYANITLAYKKIVQPSKSSVVLKARQYNNCHAQLS